MRCDIILNGFDKIIQKEVFMVPDVISDDKFTPVTIDDMELFRNILSSCDLYKNLETEISSGRARVPADPKTIETPEYKKFIHQLGELQKDYRGAQLVVHHPDEKNAHDDFPDSWALSVWGCMDKGEVNETETRDRDKFMKKSYIEQVFYRDRNKFTARRR